MTKKELAMAAYMLERAADIFGNHGCNDLDAEFIQAANLTDAEKIAFVKDYAVFSGDPEEWAEIRPLNFDHLPDFAVISFLAHKLKEESAA